MFYIFLFNSTSANNKVYEEGSIKGRDFIVYFKNGDAEITKEGEEVLKLAVNYADKSKLNNIIVSGYTDTVGGYIYNLKLSRSRTVRVSNWIINSSLSKKNISLKWFGEGKLILPTPDDTPEPLNRCVVIVVS